MEWSQPDDRGIRTHIVHVSPRRRISGERHRIASRRTDLQQVILDDIHRSLLQEILCRYSKNWRWERVLALAGSERIDLAHDLLQQLLEAGYVKVVEHRDTRGWLPTVVEPTAADELRSLARLEDREATLAVLNSALGYEPMSEPVHRLHATLTQGRPDVRLRRARLLPHMDRWLEEGRSGTRRDFALFATGHTKGIEDADWRWLEANNVLEPAGIVEHVPMLLIAGAVIIRDENDRRLDVAMAGGPIGLPATFFRQLAKATPPSAWIIIENRTVFDKASSLSGTAGLIWVPGYAPTWWTACVEMMLERLPAPGIIACDPDPAGIEIARSVVALWEKRSLSWKVVGMDAGAMDELPATAPLSLWDRTKLDKMPALPQALETFRHTLLLKERKGEQEGYFDEVRLAALVNEGQ